MQGVCQIPMKDTIPRNFDINLNMNITNIKIDNDLNINTTELKI